MSKSKSKAPNVIQIFLFSTVMVLAMLNWDSISEFIPEPPTQQAAMIPKVTISEPILIDSDVVNQSTASIRENNRSYASDENRVMEILEDWCINVHIFEEKGNYHVQVTNSYYASSLYDAIQTALHEEKCID